ncbi:MAG: Gfo/Idh/MocA family oxidoreductase [Chloroflexi bacterium]|nr:Gfo/Idh/MocA family oxidoreductase [Chloroflexota bacterium]MCY3938676.1 Gfo/Idh/MocA family oxidoreductase [Chloroflexota bacterium]
MAYTAAIIGCGGRGVDHARIDSEIAELELIACCDTDAERMQRFADEFQVEHRYDDYPTMIREIQPDVLHVVTPPAVRFEPIRLAALAGVQAIIVEKPLALNPQKCRAIWEVSKRTSCKVAVNTQGRYRPQSARMRDLLASGELGELEFVRASTYGGPLAMGPHLMDTLLFILGDVKPRAVWAAAEGLEGYEWDHGAPSHVMATYWFPDEVQVFFECSPRGMGTRGESGYWLNMHLDFWCSKGRMWASQSDTWGYELSNGESYREDVDFQSQYLRAQAAFTRAVVDWLDDPTKVHRCNLDTTLPAIDAIFGALLSASIGHQVQLPAQASDREIAAVRSALSR